MKYMFFDKTKTAGENPFPISDKINPYLLKNDTGEIKKGIEFLESDDTFFYIYGFLGTGKRQFINYVSDFCTNEVIKLEYYCKASTVCDDILLSFLDKIEKNPISTPVISGAKLITLPVKFQRYITGIKKPFLIILHSFDDILEENVKLVSELIKTTAINDNVKIIISTRAMNPNVIDGLKIDKKTVLKPLSKEIFQEFLRDNQIEFTPNLLEDFYKYTRGYYYYTALTIKIIIAMKLSLNEFLTKFVNSEMDYDNFLGYTYVNVIPEAIRNFFWFLRTLRHGISLNALAVLDLYDDFSVNYLVANLMAFISNETIYVQDYFQQNIDISIPSKIEIKLHKYIINIYEKELKKGLQERDILLSRQAFRSEIEYHNNRIQELISGNVEVEKVKKNSEHVPENKKEKPQTKIENVIPENELGSKIHNIKKLVEEKKNTEAIEAYLEIINSGNIDSGSLAEIRIDLARLYSKIGDTQKAEHYYELVEMYYKQNKEVINLNYLYYEMAELFHSVYKHERAIEILKKVVYSVDTPQSLMVSACTALGNIYSDINNSEESYNYYKKALESLDDYTSSETLSELYFKYALACDDKEDMKTAFEYYNKCITISDGNLYRAAAYSNLGVSYLDNNNLSDAKDCFEKAYKIEKENNNYDGIYFTSSYLAKINLKEQSSSAIDYLIEAKQSAEFLNESFYILASAIALGDYYYNNPQTYDKALKEYFCAKKEAEHQGTSFDISKVENRINDMKLRMNPEEFEKLEQKYDR